MSARASAKMFLRKPSLALLMQDSFNFSAVLPTAASICALIPILAFGTAFASHLCGTNKLHQNVHTMTAHRKHQKIVVKRCRFTIARNISAEWLAHNTIHVESLISDSLHLNITACVVQDSNTASLHACPYTSFRAIWPKTLFSQPKENSSISHMKKSGISWNDWLGKCILNWEFLNQYLMSSVYSLPKTNSSTTLTLSQVSTAALHHVLHLAGFHLLFYFWLQ